jgi:hypothetical protein
VTGVAQRWMPRQAAPIRSKHRSSHAPVATSGRSAGPSVVPTVLATGGRGRRLDVGIAAAEHPSERGPNTEHLTW